MRIKGYGTSIFFYALWKNRITPKHSIGMPPYQLFFGLNEKITITLELSTLKLAKAIEDEKFDKLIDK